MVEIQILRVGLITCNIQPWVWIYEHCWVSMRFKSY